MYLGAKRRYINTLPFRPVTEVCHAADQRTLTARLARSAEEGSRELRASSPAVFNDATPTRATNLPPRRPSSRRLLLLLLLPLEDAGMKVARVGRASVDVTPSKNNERGLYAARGAQTTDRAYFAPPSGAPQRVKGKEYRTR